MFLIDIHKYLVYGVITHFRNQHEHSEACRLIMITQAGNRKQVIQFVSND